MCDLTIINNNFTDNDPNIILEHTKTAYRTIAYVSDTNREQYRGLLHPHRITPLKSRVFAGPNDCYFEWGPDLRAQQIPMKPPPGVPAGMKCYKVVKPPRVNVVRNT